MGMWDVASVALEGAARMRLEAWSVLALGSCLRLRSWGVRVLERCI